MPRRRARRLVALGLGMALACSAVAPSFAAPPATAPAAKVLWSKVRSFRIPVTVPAKNKNLVRELILFVSDDSGYTWKKSRRTTPDIPEFAFVAPRDGEFWFAVQTLDKDGKYYPAGDRQAEPTLKVIVDSTRPVIRLEGNVRKGSEAGVRWEVQDEHLLPKSLMLEYQAVGAREWRQVHLDQGDPRLIGEKIWDAGTADAVKVRMTVRDRAGNVGTAEVLLPDGLAENPGPAQSESRLASAPPQVSPIATRGAPTPSAEDDPFGAVDAPPGPSSPVASPSSDELADSRSSGDHSADPFPPPESAPSPSPSPRNVPSGTGSGPTLLVAAPRFSLKYEVQDAGPGGPAIVELWTTADGGRTWRRQPEDADRTSPYEVDLGGEGTFGLRLVVQSATGLGDPPPAPGDRPDSWVEVDSASPIVSMDRPKVGTGANASKVAITWRAGDPHLARQPITISYRADRPDSPWVVVADRLENSGRYIWSVPASAPPRFHLKVEARDTLGNRGSADTLDLGPVLLDRVRPRGKIIGLDQGTGTLRQ